jgi:hypothetical protein
MQSHRPAESGNESGACCVLWHARGRTPSAELLGALSRRRCTVRAVQSGFGAIAELCLLERALTTSSRHAVLLLVEPEMLEDRAMVLAAMRRYAPGSLAWIYEPGANNPLRALVEERPEPRRQEGPVVRSPGSHALRLAGEGPSLDSTEAPADKDDEQGTGLGHLLSDEELSLLLDEPETRAGGSVDGE